MELLNFVMALALIGAAWFVTVRILAWTMTRASGRPRSGKPLPMNRRARIRQFAASVRHAGVR